MQSFIVLVLSVALAWNAPEVAAKWPTKPKSTLRLLHVLFRHGHRNPEVTSMWPTNSYADASNYPEGWGQLTNEGKLTEYKLGELFRERYDEFLGDTYNIDYVDFRCDDFNRTKMSGELVMAGLWPPRGANVWNILLPWQPIPFNYVPLTDDSLLYPFLSSEYTAALAEVYASDEIQRYLAERYGEAMQILSENTGCSPTDYQTAWAYWDTMKVQKELGFKLEPWASQVYPEPLTSLTIDNYHIMTNTTKLRRIIVGTLVKKILTDTYALINGTLSPSARKMFVYSAHDTNVGPMYLSLNAYQMNQSPPYGSAVIFEVHVIDLVWGIKLFLVDYTKGSPHPLTLPGCSHFCPIDQFYSLVEEILP